MSQDPAELKRKIELLESSVLDLYEKINTMLEQSAQERGINLQVQEAQLAQVGIDAGVMGATRLVVRALIRSHPNPDGFQRESKKAFDQLKLVERTSQPTMFEIEKVLEDYMSEVPKQP